MATKPQECPQAPRNRAGTLLGVFGYTLVCVLTELLGDACQYLLFSWVKATSFWSSVSTDSVFYSWLVWYFLQKLQFCLSCWAQSGSIGVVQNFPPK